MQAITNKIYFPVWDMVVSATDVTAPKLHFRNISVNLVEKDSFLINLRNSLVEGTNANIRS